jgi:SHAQKYF class myb-like DNA-binding protein
MDVPAAVVDAITTASTPAVTGITMAGTEITALPTAAAAVVDVNSYQLPPARLVEPGKENTGRWTRPEHALFLRGMEVHGKEWKKVAAIVGTRTVMQTRTHAQKYFEKLEAIAAKAAGKPNPKLLKLAEKGKTPKAKKAGTAALMAPGAVTATAFSSPAAAAAVTVIAAPIGPAQPPPLRNFAITDNDIVLPGKFFHLLSFGCYG